jgi:predicted CXXCH cytochrome family protein
MPGPRTSRYLSERVEIEFHRRGNRFRRLTWWTGLAAALVCAGWLGWAAFRDQQVIYAAGAVARPHAFIEHDCQKCHTAWGLGQRLIAWDDSIRSIDDQACNDCHRAPKHHANQVPRHDQISCAKCHLEHRGADAKLADVANQFCVECHSDLRTTHGTSTTFASSVEAFQSRTHPETALQRVLVHGMTSTGRQPDSKHGVFRVIAELQRPSDPAPRWQDQAQLAFNHAKHLKVERDASGKIISALRNKDREFVDLSEDSCTACHQLDAERRYMQPIKYEQHCRDCHPLPFDIQNFPDKSVPHGRPDLVRGYLTEQYSNLVLGGGAPTEVQPLKQPSRRPKPGERVDSAPATTPTPSAVSIPASDYGEQIRELVAKAERAAIDSVQPILGQMTRGGCRYCHVVNDVAGNPPWEVVHPNIPKRWLSHSVFNHDSHRFQKCDECHVGVNKSSSTGDVLIPSIRVCLKCHSSDQAERSPDLKIAGARSNCVECHVYHHRP